MYNVSLFFHDDQVEGYDNNHIDEDSYIHLLMLFLCVECLLVSNVFAGDFNIFFSVAKDYVRLMKYGDTLYRCKQLKKAALGRYASNSIVVQ